MKTTYNFPEEKTVCGQKGTIKPLTLGYERMSEYKNNVFAQRVTSHPWWVILWEPISTKVPGPHLTEAYCCYIRTVIFYVRGYVIRPFSTPIRWTRWGYEKPNTTYQTWGRVETVFRIDDVIEFEGESFEICGGSIIWHHKQWWCRYNARRKDQPKPVTDFNIQHVS